MFFVYGGEIITLIIKLSFSEKKEAKKMNCFAFLIKKGHTPRIRFLAGKIYFPTNVECY